MAKSVTFFLGFILSVGIATAQEATTSQDTTAPPYLSLRVPSAAVAGPQSMVPRLMKFSGALRDLSGKPLSGAVDVTFSLYSTEAGGEPLWFETQSVQADELGRYTALLGAMHTDGLPMDLFTSGEAHWLGIQVGLEAEQQPRVLLVSVPYALKAGDAETLGGKPASAYMLSDSENGSTSAPGIYSSGAASMGGGSGESPTKSRTANTTYFTACSRDGSDSTAALSSMAMFTADCVLGGSAIFQSNGNIGIGTASPQAALQIGSGFGSYPGFKFVTWDSNAQEGVAIGYFGAANSIQGRSGPDGGLNSNLTLNPYGGNVGIATLSPAALLQIGDGFGLENTGFKLVTWDSNAQEGVGIGYFGAANSIQGRSGLDGGVNSDLTLNPYAGNVGIGTTAPAATLDVNGNANFSGLVTFAPGQNFGGSTSMLTGSTGAFNGSTTNQVLSATQSGAGAAAVLNNTVGGNILVGQNNGTQEFAVDGSGSVTASGNLNLPLTPTGGAIGVINVGGLPFIHACCAMKSYWNVFIGYGAGNYAVDATGTGGNVGENVGVGYNALHTVSSGIYNTALGPNALYGTTTGVGNAAVGYSSLQSNSSGGGNTAIGGAALPNNISGSENTAIGATSLDFNSSGSNNVAIGVSSLSTNTTGSYNSGLGPRTDVGSINLTNATAIGACALVSASNSLVLGAPNGGGGFACSPYVTANTNVGIDVPSPSNIFTVLQGGGHAVADGWDTYSSRRWKSNIQPLHGALGKVERLRGVSYTYTANGKHDIGMIAEEVGKVVPEVVSYEENAMDARGIDYARLTALLVEAVKEQQKEVQQQQRQIRHQITESRTLQERVRRLETAGNK